MERREGYTECEKKKMLLSAETSTGIKLTGKYLIICIPDCACQSDLHCNMI